jgi:hypothetical protein
MTSCPGAQTQDKFYFFIKNLKNLSGFGLYVAERSFTKKPDAKFVFLVRNIL